MALYAVLADKGLFAMSELDSFCYQESILGGHPEHRVPGVEASTGALGHGLSIGVGMALAAKINNKNHNNNNNIASRIPAAMPEGPSMAGRSPSPLMPSCLFDLALLRPPALVSSCPHTHSSKSLLTTR